MHAGQAKAVELEGRQADPSPAAHADLGQEAPRLEPAPRLDAAVDDPRPVCERRRHDAEGRGVARNAGKVVFVEGAITGERVEARLLESKSKFDRARVTAVLRASASRREPPCPQFGTCGGCATQHVDAPTQVAAKQRWLEDNLARIGKLSGKDAPGAMLAPIHGAEWGYRHRARLSVRYVESKGGALVGFRERKSTYVADMKDCMVLPPAVSALIPELRSLISKLSIRPAKAGSITRCPSSG